MPPGATIGVVATKLIEMAPNGRLVIPRELRAELGVRDAEQFTAEVRGGSIVLTPAAVVPLDRGFPITAELVVSAGRAAAEPGPGISRGALHALLAAK